MPGGASNPKIVGSANNEFIYGTPDSDRIDGRGGDDIINGYCGNDTLTGGSGADTFVMDRTYQGWSGGQDVITDFSAAAGGHDKLQFNGWGGFTAARSGALFVGETFQTDQGHVLTVRLDANGGTLLVWDTGDSFDLRGVTPSSLDAGWFVSA